MWHRIAPAVKVTLVPTHTDSVGAPGTLGAILNVALESGINVTIREAATVQSMDSLLRAPSSV